jgi:anaerobic magnesium-protoporphyrin IX monomethyl ester cyclase
MKILLTTLHAKYVHNSLALPCLAAACEGLDGISTVIREFTVNEPSDRVLATIVETEYVSYRARKRKRYSCNVPD